MVLKLNVIGVQALGRVCHWRFYTGTLWINVCFGSFENLSKMHAIVYDARSVSNVK